MYTLNLNIYNRLFLKKVLDTSPQLSRNIPNFRIVNLYQTFIENVSFIYIQLSGVQT